VQVGEEKETSEKAENPLGDIKTAKTCIPSHGNEHCLFRGKKSLREKGGKGRGGERKNKVREKSSKRNPAVTLTALREGRAFGRWDSKILAKNSRHPTRGTGGEKNAQPGGKGKKGLGDLGMFRGIKHGKIFRRRHSVTKTG